MSIISNKLEIINAVITSILYATFGIFCASVMDYLPRVKTSTKMLCHYEAVLRDTIMQLSHRVEKIIGRYCQHYIAVMHCSTSFIRSVLATIKDNTIMQKGTSSATLRKVLISDMRTGKPTTLSAIRTSRICESLRYKAITYFSPIFSFTFNWHSFILPQVLANVNDLRGARL